MNTIDAQVRERLDSGDVHGAVKLILKKSLPELATALPAQDSESLNAQRARACYEFCARHPEAELQFSNQQAAEAFGERMAVAVKYLGLDGSSVEHWERGWRVEQANRPAPRQAESARVPQPAPTQPTESVDELTAAARDLIHGQGGVHGFRSYYNGLTATQVEAAMRSMKFQRAVELCYPQDTPSLLTRGDHVSAAQAVRAAEISGTDPRAVERAIAKSRDLHEQSYARYRERPAGPEGGKPHWGPSLENRHHAQARRRAMTAEDARVNEQANLARSGQPLKARADAVREAQEREAKEKQDRWKR